MHEHCTVTSRTGHPNFIPNEIDSCINYSTQNNKKFHFSLVSSSSSHKAQYLSCLCPARTGHYERDTPIQKPWTVYVPSHFLNLMLTQILYLYSISSYGPLLDNSLMTWY